METDETLLNAARRMDQDALIKIFDLYSSGLFKYALHLCGDPIVADHIVGDVFAKLLEQILAGNGPTSNLRSYLYKTVYHTMIDEARYSKRRAPLEVAGSLWQDTHSALQNMEDYLLLKQVLQAVQTDLTGDQRHVIILRFLEGCTLHETATIMGKTVNHIKVLQNRAVAALRKSLESQENRKVVFTPKFRNLSNAPGV